MAFEYFVERRTCWMSRGAGSTLLSELRTRPLWNSESFSRPAPLAPGNEMLKQLAGSRMAEADR